MDKRISYKDLLTAIGADRNRLNKLQKDVSKLNKRYFFLDGDHIFNTPANEHPLVLSDPKNIGNARWITVSDIDYLILVMIYALLRAAWEKKYSRNRDYQRYIISRDDEDSHPYTSKRWHDNSR
jgi:hypothetical protein